MQTAKTDSSQLIAKVRPCDTDQSIHSSIHLQKLTGTDISSINRNAWTLSLSLTQVYDQYLDFISLEDRLFTLRQHNSFQAFNDPSISDSVAQQSMESVVDSLFSALVTLVR